MLLLTSVCPWEEVVISEKGLPHLVEVVDELRQILNGVDVVMGGRGDQGHARLAAPEVGDVGADLLGRQLASFTCTTAHSHQLATAGIRDMCNVPSLKSFEAFALDTGYLSFCQGSTLGSTYRTKSTDFKFKRL